MSPPLELVLSGDVQEHLRREIAAAGGAEVFFLGRCDPAGVVVAVEVAARGSETAVPALLSRAVGFQAAIHNHPSGDLRPTEGDLRAAGLLANLGLGFLIVNDGVTEAYEAIPMPRQRRFSASPLPRAQTPTLEPAQISEFFADGGPLAAVLGQDYEPRPQQVDLARAVAEAFRGDGIGLFEAGTGTGKTFAYLVPAALSALRSGEKVVISTATKNLQGQLSRKDVPALQVALRAAGIRGRPSGEEGEPEEEREPLRVSVAKGRSNYVSLRRAAEAGQQEQLAFGDDHERREVLRLVAWARETRTGDRVELVPPPSSDAWEHVNSTSDNCLGRECPTYRECHFFAQRRRAHAAQLVIVNHHLLFSDLAIKLSQGFDQAAVLPPFTRVILDEAHHVEDIASEYFGLQVTEYALARPLAQLEGRRGRGGGRGLLPALQQQLQGEALSRLARTLEERIRPLREDVLRSVEDAFHLVALELRHSLPATQGEAREVKLRVSEELVPLFAPLEDARAALVLLVSRLGRLLDEAKPIMSLAQEESSRALRLQVRGLLRRLERGASGLEEFLGGIGYRVAPLELGGIAAPARSGPGSPSAPSAQSASPEAPTRPPDAGGVASSSEDAGSPSRPQPTNPDDAVSAPRIPSEQIRWIELYRDRRRRDRLRLRSAPLEVGPHLVPALFAPARSVVLTSATLAVAGGTEFLEARLGLDRWRREYPARPLLQAQIPSPFDYPRQALLGVPSDLPLPERSDFGPATTAALDALLEASRGRAFALFTSYGALQRAFHELAPRLERRGLLPLCQGNESRESLLERFRATRGAVLFGTDSFWEGVDVPGDALVLVVIAKLPFGVPSEPLQIARAEAVTARGGSAFHELSLPQAVLKLKQGFGRLIRSHSDRGAVVVLDRRLVTRAYGRAFLESLPPARLEIAPLIDVVAAVRRITST